MGETIMSKKRLFLLIITCSSLFFASCENALTVKGTVYSNDTKEPLKGARITFVLDSEIIQKSQAETDTVPKDKRMEMRKQGIKDDYGPQIFGFGRYVIPYTNDTGRFVVGSILLRKYHNWKLIVSKEGYKTDTFGAEQVSDKYSGNFKIYLKKAE